MVSKSKELRSGDLVWAKMKGYVPWPGRIIEAANKKNSKQRTYIYFFGTENCGWVLSKNVYPYDQYKLEFSKKLRSASFKKAVLQIEKSYQENCSSDEDIPLSAITKKNSKKDSIKINGASKSLKMKSKRVKKIKIKPIISVLISNKEAIRKIIPKEARICIKPCTVEN